MLPFEELEAITNDYFKLEDGKATDIYYNTSYFLNLFLKQQKGLWDRPKGGRLIRIPLEYTNQVGGFYAKGDTISSDDKESVTAAYTQAKHAYGNATIYRIDGLENAGSYAAVQLVSQRVAGAQKTITEVLAKSIYDEPGGSADRLTGLMACCHETASLDYEGLSEDDVPKWEGKRKSIGAAITLNKIRDLASLAKVHSGKGGKPDLVITTEDLWNAISDILTAQQRFTKATAADAGFTGVHFEGKDIVVDDYIPPGYCLALNSNYVGFAVYESGLFSRSPWRVIPDSPEDRTMKIYFDGNIIVNHRAAHALYTDLS